MRYEQHGRRGPNVLVTGTPGTGKTTLCELLVTALGGTWRHVNVGQLVKDKSLHDGYDGEYDTFMLNEDKVCEHEGPTAVLTPAP